MTATMINPKARRGGDARGNTNDRRARKAYLVQTYRADTDALITVDVHGAIEQINPMPGVSVENLLDHFTGDNHYISVDRVAACRCFRCGELLTVEAGNITADRIVPGCVKIREYPNGGTYARKNIRPCCSGCNSRTGNEFKAALKLVKA